MFFILVYRTWNDFHLLYLTSRNIEFGRLTHSLFPILFLKWGIPSYWCNQKLWISNCAELSSRWCTRHYSSPRRSRAGVNALFLTSLAVIANYRRPLLVSSHSGLCKSCNSSCSSSTESRREHAVLIQLESLLWTFFVPSSETFPSGLLRSGFVQAQTLSWKLYEGLGETALSNISWFPTLRGKSLFLSTANSTYLINIAERASQWLEHGMATRFPLVSLVTATVFQGFAKCLSSASPICNIKGELLCHNLLPGFMSLLNILTKPLDF